MLVLRSMAFVLGGSFCFVLALLSLSFAVARFWFCLFLYVFTFHCLSVPAQVAQRSALRNASLKVVGSNPISHVNFFGSDRLLPRAGSAVGPVGRLGPHS